MYNILVCDDDKDIVSALEIYLSGGEYQVFKAYSGEEALSIMSQEKIHLVLMDIMMPHMDGIRATQELRKTSNVPVLFLTAKGEDTDKIQGLNAGGDDYITKPFNPMEVLARVRSQLRRYTVLGGRACEGGRPDRRPHRAGHGAALCHGGRGAGHTYPSGVRHSASADGAPWSGLFRAANL